MASKGLKKLWNKVTGGKQKAGTETVDERIKEQEKNTEDRVRELSLAQLLTDVELSLGSSSCKLSKEKLDELGTRSVLKRARYELVEHPVVTDEDMSEIDSCIKYIIYEISRAAEQGYETSAHWATVALATATETLHIPIKGNDLEYTSALMEKKREYARNLKLLTQNALAYDEYTTELKDKTRRYQAKEKEIEVLGKATQQILDSEDGPWLLAQVRDNSDDLSKLTDPRALDLRTKLLNMHYRESEFIAYAIDVNAAGENQTMYAQQLDQCRNHIANFPRVTDPKLAAKNQEAAEAYAAELRRRLNNAEAGMKAIAANLSELMSLGSHTLFQTGTAHALDAYAQMQLRKIKEKESQLEAAKAAIREKEQNRVLKRIEQELAEQLNQLAQEDEEEAINIAQENLEEELEKANEELQELAEDDEEDLLIEDID